MVISQDMNRNMLHDRMGGRRSGKVVESMVEVLNGLYDGHTTSDLTDAEWESAIVLAKDL
jgi:hypothetical protein